ncbi:MAG: immunoglobulin-like domain-containing protein [Bacilli bacterium]
MSGDVSAARSTLTLPTTGVNGSTITWVADPADLIDENGVVGAGSHSRCNLNIDRHIDTRRSYRRSSYYHQCYRTSSNTDTVAEARAVATRLLK